MELSEYNRNMAYYDLVKSKKLSEQEEAVFRTIFHNPDLTDREISEFCGIDRSSVNGRRNDLVNEGLVKASGSKNDVTGRICTTWRVTVESDKKESPSYLTDAEMKKIEKLLIKANIFQKNKIRQILEKQDAIN